jgi:hypothetical protein
MEQTEGATPEPVVNITVPIRYSSTRPDDLLDVRELDMEGHEIHYHEGVWTYCYKDEQGREVNLGPRKPTTKWMTVKEGKPAEEAARLHDTQDISSEAIVRSLLPFR